VNAEDDPLIPRTTWPLEATDANPNVIFVSTRSGGHIGWCEGLNPLKGKSWADRLVGEYLTAALATRPPNEHLSQSALDSAAAAASGNSSSASKL
jgi:predicted alpha/beta-fold hydrolase